MALAVINNSSHDLSYLTRVDPRSSALQNSSPRSCSQSSSLQITTDTIRDTPVTQRSSLKAARTGPNIDFEPIDIPNLDGDETWNTLDNIAAIGLTLEKDEDDVVSQSVELPSILPDGDPSTDGRELAPHTARPFHKWMKNLQRRAHRPSIHVGEEWMEAFPHFTHGNNKLSSAGHRNSSSSSSFDFVTAVKSASVSLASASVITRRRHQTGRSSTCARTDRSSRASMSVPRYSEDSTCFEGSLEVDPAVNERLLQRRRILEELISTEESYIGDVKFLMNVYVTILASLPTSHPELRSSINRNLTDIVELHEGILGDLHRVVPNSEYTQPERPQTVSHQPAKEHHRWHSLDSVPEGKGGKSRLQSAPGMTTDPSVAAEVAQVFGKRINRFFIYEEYGAKYEMMIIDVASAHRTLPQWETYQKGLEALAASLGSAHQHIDRSKKSLTIGDLLVKPIQRICRYPLLFAEILKYTPVCDCPYSHMEIENVLIRLREATAEINRATDNPGMKARIEATWLLQDRLVFSNQRLDASKNMIRSFGQIQLCGALHVCWQSKDGVNGQYMVTLLYKDYLVLATAGRADQIYIIQACISLDSIRVEAADNGRGLQCHTAPFSWKLVFECDHQLYEIILTACTPREETEWRTRLMRPDLIDPLETTETAPYSTIFLNIKSLGTVFGKPGTVARRVSIHRATTVGPKSALCQVILKNTSTLKDISVSLSRRPINRSQSLLTTNSRTPVLAPSRGERARLEALLADVWSRKDLPFPGITTRSRSEHLVRNSATTVMRKLSVANFASSLSKRSTSVPSMAKANDDTLSRTDPNTLDIRSNDRSDCTSTPDDEAESSKPVLPSIRDGSERNRSINSRLLDGDSATLSGTVRKIDLTRLDTAWSTGDEGVGIPTLRSLPANSSRQPSPSAESDTSTTPSSPGKENTSQKGRKQERFIRSPLSNMKSSSKWSRVSTIKREMVASGLRGFFR